MRNGGEDWRILAGFGEGCAVANAELASICGRVSGLRIYAAAAAQVSGRPEVRVGF